MTKNCSKCQQSFEIRDSDRIFYERFAVPDPEKCPDCRMQQRMCFRNERLLYSRKCSLTGENIISIYHEKSPHKVYHPTQWWSDKWDGLEHGRTFDFNRPFFEQFKELMLAVPRIALFNVNPFNSEYCQQAYDNKNCYLCTVIKDCEDCMYLSHTNNATDSYDCDYTQHVQLCINCLDSEKLYGCANCQSCQNSNDLFFCYDCIGCHNCFGCTGLRNKSHYIFNKPHNQEEYKEKMQSLALNQYSVFLKSQDYFRDIFKKAIHRSNWNINTLNCIGNYLIHGKDSYLCFDSFEIQDCAYCTWIFKSHDVQDIYGMGTSEWVYDSLGVENLHNAAFNTFVSDSTDVFYSDICFYSQNLFGCVGLRNKKYCILNKEYSPEEYKSLKAKIIEHMKKTGEWGQFFPVSFSPFGYNESVASEQFPSEKEEAIAQGFNWCDYEPAPPKVEKVVDAEKLPDTNDLENVPDAVLQYAIKCAKSGKLFILQKKELAYYRQMNLPLPRYHPNVRYDMRMQLRNPRKLYKRSCQKCQKDILTTYAPERSETVYCETCYNAEIY